MRSKTTIKGKDRLNGKAVYCKVELTMNDGKQVVTEITKKFESSLLEILENHYSQITKSSVKDWRKTK